MHKYWSKKPSDVIAAYIEKYSKPGDVVLDCFAGSGITLIEAVRLRRRAIGLDINPAAVFMTEAALRRVDIKRLSAEFTMLKEYCAPIINALYATVCSVEPEHRGTATHLIWNNGVAEELWYECLTCKADKNVKSPGVEDTLRSREPTLAPLWYPTDELHANARINVKGGAKISDLFTKRALTALSVLFDRIQQICSDDERLILLNCFTAALPQASRMVFVIRRRGKKTGNESAARAEVGSWVIGFWVPKEHFEINVWRCFENRFARTLRGKQELETLVPPDITQSDVAEDVIRGTADWCIALGDAAGLSLPDSSVDYAFIDPPHGNRIPYLELSMIWNSWLKQPTDWSNEIIVSDARGRSKGIADYNGRMELVFQQLHRVLRDEAFLSIAFNSLDDDTWISFVSSIVSAGFDIRNVEPLAYSSNSVVQDNRKNALQTDFVITCKKRLNRRAMPMHILDASDIINNLVSAAVAKHGGTARTYEVLNHGWTGALLKGSIIKPSAVVTRLEATCIVNGERWSIND